jgi:hypothetical protein
MRQPLYAVVVGHLLLFAGTAPAAPDKPAPPAPKAPDLTQPLQEVLAGKRPLEKVRIDVNWPGNVSNRYATVYGTGTGIWNREQQFTMPREQVLGLLQKMDRAKFTAMPDRLGGTGRPDGEAPPAVAPRVSGSLVLNIGGLIKGVLGGSEPPKEFTELAIGVLDACTAAARRNGVGADSLADGLRKVAKQELAPQCIHLMVSRLIEDRNARAEGLLLLLLDGVVETRSYTPGECFGPRVRMELTPRQLEALCKLLVENQAGALPATLWAEHPTTFAVGVLNHSKDVQARPFERMTPQTHGDRQKQFDRLFEGLMQLHHQVLRDGKPVGEEK